VISAELLDTPPAAGSESDSTASSKAASDTLSTADLFKHPTMRKNLLIMFVNWIVITLGESIL
jgi:hypothetical protein